METSTEHEDRQTLFCVCGSSPCLTKVLVVRGASWCFFKFWPSLGEHFFDPIYISVIITHIKQITFLYGIYTINRSCFGINKVLDRKLPKKLFYKKYAYSLIYISLVWSIFVLFSNSHC